MATPIEQDRLHRNCSGSGFCRGLRGLAGRLLSIGEDAVGCVIAVGSEGEVGALDASTLFFSVLVVCVERGSIS
jgi:hypothetical protein